LPLRNPIKVKKPVEEGDASSVDRESSKVVKSTKRTLKNADLFRRNRKKAMNQIKSSKNGFKYNYGGYVPLSSKKKKKKKKIIINSDDFDDFLVEEFCDFVPLLIFQKKREMEAKTEEEAGAEIDEEAIVQEKMKQEEERQREKDKKMETLFAADKKMWNPEVLDYLAEIK
jgi:hypothetical protein